MKQHFLYEYAGNRYGLPLVNISEIVEVEDLQYLPGNSLICRGAFVHRNELVPILDSQYISCQKTSEIKENQPVVILRVGSATFGLTMERFTTVVSVDEMSEPVEPSTPHHSPYIEALRGYQNSPVTMISADKLARFVSELVANQQIITSGVEKSQTTVTEVGPEVQKLLMLCAELHGIRFGITLEDVMEVIEGYDVTRLFRVAPSLRGLINLRGGVLACIDISGYLNLDQRVLEENNQFVVLQYDGTDLALCVDRVAGIRSIPKSSVQDVASVSVGDMARLLSGVVELDDGPLFLLSAKAVFNSSDLQPYLREDA